MNMIFHIASSHLSILVLKSNHITSERSNQMTRAEIDWLYPTVHVKYHVLGNVLKRTFKDSFRQNLSSHLHCQNILQSTSYQIRNFLPSCWCCLLTLWLEICVHNNKFGFSGNNCYKLMVKLCWHSFKWFCPQISSEAKYFFLSCPRHSDRGLIVIIIYYFQNWNKEHNIFISRVINSHMGPHVYWNTLYRQWLVILW